VASEKRKIKIAFIGGGSLSWSANILRDIIFKEGLDELDLDIRLLDLDMPRAELVRDYVGYHLKEWGVDRVKLTATTEPDPAIEGADFVLITISTGRLETMKWDVELPEKYGIYATVGDTAGPGGWSRSLRNIPVFRDYAEKIKKLAPNAYVLNYTNPMGTLTKVLSDALGREKVVGLCHGLFECYEILKSIFGLESEKDINVRFGGMNHFFWIVDLKIKGDDGFAMLRERLGGRNLSEILQEVHTDAMGWSSDKWLAGELFREYGYLPYVGDRHTCEFIGCYLSNKDLMERFKLKRTSIKDREDMYAESEKRHRDGIAEKKMTLERKASRETAADIMKAIIFDEMFVDVVNTPNMGQISNMPYGAVVETLGLVDGMGFTPLTVGPLPEPVRALCAPHAQVQLRVVEAGLSGDLEAALLALAADPACAHMTVSDIKKMGTELLEANRAWLPQFFA
jgi:galacturan 1,4-alpha-galacturonidase